MKHIPATFGKITVAHIQRSYLSRLVIIIAVFSLGYHPANGKDWYYNVDVGAAFINGPKTLFFAERDENAPFGRLANLKVDEGEGWGLGVGGTLGRPLDTPLFNAHGFGSNSVYSTLIRNRQRIVSSWITDWRTIRLCGLGWLKWF